MKPRNYLSLILSVLYVAPAAASQSFGTSSAVDKASAVEDGAVPEGLQADDWASIRAAYEAGRHAFFATDQGHQARSHGNAWRARFDGRGVTLAPDAGDWSFGLELERYGFEGALVAAEQAGDVHADGQHLTYDWDADLSEWWKNDGRGLEHGFTVHERPQRVSDGSDGPLVFDMAVRGDLRPSLMASGRGLRLVNAQGAAVLTYDGLVAFDADGTPLEAWLEVTEFGMRIAVLEEAARYPLTVDPVMQTAYLKASNTKGGDRFGFAVAVSGSTVVVGANGEDSNATGVNGDQSDNSLSSAGAAYVFVRTGSTWSQQAYLKASNPDALDEFGSKVAISGDTVVVGANFEDSIATGVNGDQSSNSADGAGAAYVYVRTGSTWIQQAYLKASNTDASDQFGFSVAVSGDTVVIGAYGEGSSATGVNGDQSDDSLSEAGAAYVFVRTGSTWSQQTYLKASNTDDGDRFGFSVAVSGNTAIVGASREDSNATGVNGDQSDNSTLNSGAAYAFVRTGSTWSQQAYLKASNTDAGDLLGRSVAVSGDTMVVGAIRERSNATGVNGDQSDDSLFEAGAAYVFVRTGSAWSQQAYLKASNTEFRDRFGHSVDVSGNTVVVGAFLESSSATGVDGDQSDNSAPKSGAAYVFVRTGSTWSQQAYLKASNTDASDQFGFSVAVSGDSVVVGAFQEGSLSTGVNGDQSDNGASSAGATYIYDLSSLGTISSDICTGEFNSTGVGSVLTIGGSIVVADNDLVLDVSDLPLDTMGYFIHSAEAIFVANPGGSAGNLCIASFDIGRFAGNVLDSGATGTVSLAPDLTAFPGPNGPFAVVAGETRSFQYWHRDTDLGGGSTSNFSSAVGVAFK